MKKGLLVFLSVLTLIALLASCGEQVSSVSTTVNSSVHSASPDEPSDGPTESSKSPDISPKPSPDDKPTPSPDESKPKPSEKIKFFIQNIEGKKGELVTVPVYVSNNPGIAGFSITLKFPKDQLVFKDFENKVPGGFAVFNDKVEGQVKIMCAMGNNDIRLNDVVAILTFEVKSDAANGNYDLSLSLNDKKDTVYTVDHSGKTTDIPCTFENGSILIQ